MWGGARKFVRKQAVPIVLVAMALGTSSAVTLLHGDALSPIDEWVYVDYLYKIPDQGIVLKGEEIGEEALDIIACDGVTPYGPMGAPCGGDYSNPGDFPFGGITSADPYTPIYFAVTRFVGDFISAVTGVDQLVGWRLTSPLWLVAGVLALAALMRQWRAKETAVLAVGLAFIGSPFSYWTYSYVSTDAPAFFFGALLLYLATRFVRGEVNGWWIIVVGTIGTLIKVTNVLAVGLVALYVLSHWLAEVRRVRAETGERWGGVRGTRRLLGVAVGASAAAILSQAVWLTVNRLTAVTDARAEQGISYQLTVDALLAQFANFLPGTIVSNVNIAGSTGLAFPIPGYAVAPLSWLCIAGVLGAFFLLKRGESTAPLVIAIAIASVAFAPALSLAFQIITSSYFSFPARYGAAILPGFLLLAGLLLKNRVAVWLVVGYGFALCAVTVVIAALLGPHFAAVL
jgi:hypothetical protein